MAALNFPSSPTLGQQHTENGKTWEWDGSAWFLIGSATSQTSLQFQDEGSDLGTPGTVDTLDVVGPNIAASRTGNTVTITETPQTITLTGDVTGSGTGSFAATIANNAVSFAKMQDITTDTLIGRFNAGTGDPELITCTAAGRALLAGANAAAQRTTLGLAAMATVASVSLTGDATGSGTSSITVTLANTSVSAAAYRLGASFTVDSKGRLTAAANRNSVSATLALGNNNDYAIAANTDILLLTGNVSGSTITGISVTNKGVGSVVRIINVGSVNITVAPNNAASLAANRITANTNNNYFIPPAGMVTLVYSTLNIWHLLDTGHVSAANGNSSRVGIGFSESVSTGFIKISTQDTVSFLINGNTIFNGNWNVAGVSNFGLAVPISISLSADPSTFVNGMLWYNNTSHEYKARYNGTTSFVLQNRASHNGVAVVDRNTTAVTVQNTVAETSIYSVTLNGPTTTNNKITNVRITGVIYNNSGINGNWRLRMKFNGTTFWDGSFFYRQDVNIAPFEIDLLMSDTGALQVFSGHVNAISFNLGGAIAPAIGNGNVDTGTGNYGGPFLGSTSVTTSGNHTLEFTVELGAASINFYSIRYTALTSSN